MDAKNKYFERFKPARNFLRKLNLFDSLYVLRQYTIAYGANKDNKYLLGVENSSCCGVAPNIIDFCIVNSFVYSPTHRCNRSIANLNDRRKLLSTIVQIEEEVNKNAISGDVWLWLHAFGLNQSKQHTGIFASDIYRYFKIFNDDESIRRVIENKIGISYKDFIACSIWIYATFSKTEGFCVPKSYLLDIDRKYESTPYRIKNLDAVLRFISKPLDEMISLCKDNVSYGDDMFWIFSSPHIHFPLIEFETNLYCVSPQYLLNQITAGMYYIADLPNAGLQNQFGKSFENYVGYILSESNANTSYVMTSEIKYGKGGKKTSDWIVYETEEIVFIECKTKRLQEQSKRQSTLEIQDAKNPLLNDIEALANGVTQLYKVYNDYINGNIDTLPYVEGRQFVPLLVILEYMFYVPKIKDKITELVKLNLQKIGIEESIVDTFEYQIIPMPDFEKKVQIMVKEGFCNFFQSKTKDGGEIDDNYHNEFEYTDYFTEHFHKDFIEPYLELEQN